METSAICTADEAGLFKRWGSFFATIHGRRAIVGGFGVLPHDEGGFKVRASGKYHEHEARGTRDATDEQGELVAKLTWSDWSSVIIH